MYLKLPEHFIFTGKQEAVDATLMALEVIAEPLKSMAQLLVEVCAYAGNNLFCVEIFTIIIFFFLNIVKIISSDLHQKKWYP